MPFTNQGRKALLYSGFGKDESSTYFNIAFKDIGGTEKSTSSTAPYNFKTAAVGVVRCKTAS